jgi:integrase/recombinase XerD
VFGREGDYLFTHRRGKPYCRQTLYKWINQVFYEALHIEVSPHTRRHFFATEKIVREKKDIKGVSLYLGHSTTAVTMDMYVQSKLTPEEAILEIGR